YFGARYYDPTLYRFLSPDPVIPTDRAIYNPQRWNLYGYCLGNPLRFVEKTGLDPANILVLRLWEISSQKITVGYIFMDGRWGGYTMEHNTKGKLPEGDYEAQIMWAKMIWGQEVWALVITNYLTKEGNIIAFHLGWSPEHSDGCFLIGFDYDFTNNKLINSTSAFAELMGGCISHYDLGRALLAYEEAGLGEVFWAWLELDALSGIVHAKVSVKQAYIGDVPESSSPWDPLMLNPIYWA
ncbi:MAG: DUF5675 family protein, partial [Candidatus Saccharicenans sp.]